MSSNVHTPWQEHNETMPAPSDSLRNNSFGAFIIALVTNSCAGVFFVLLFCYLRTRNPEYYSRGQKVTGFISQVQALTTLMRGRVATASIDASLF